MRWHIQSWFYRYPHTGMMMVGVMTVEAFVFQNQYHYNCIQPPENRWLSHSDITYARHYERYYLWNGKLLHSRKYK